MSYGSITINNVVYVANSKAAYDALVEAKNSGDQTQVDNVVKQYKTQITLEDDLQELDESGASYDRGFDYESYNSYTRSIGMDSLSDKSSVEDFIAVYDKIAHQIDEFDKIMRDKSYTSNPDKIEALLTSMTNTTQALNDLGGGLELNLPTSGNGWKIAGGAVGTAAGVAGVAATVAGVSMSIPVAGWVVAGVAGLVAIGAGIVGLVSNDKAKKKMEKLKKDIMSSSEQLSKQWDTVEKNIQNNGKTVVKDATKALDGLLNEKFDFKDITDVKSVSKNIDKIIEQQGILEPWYNISQKWGIKIDGLDKVMDTLGSGDNSLQHAQKYFDDYIEQVDMGIEDEVIKDTDTLNTLYANLSKLGNEMETKGIDTTSLDEFLDKVRKKNQEEADEKAREIVDGAGSGGSSGGTYGVGGGGGGGSYGGVGGGAGAVDDAGGQIDASNTAGDTAEGIKDNSTTYDTSTDELEKAKREMFEAAQKTVDDYLNSVTTSGKSIAELEELYNELSTNKDAFAEISSELDLSGFPGKMQEVRDAQQGLVDSYLANVQTTGTIGDLEQTYQDVTAMHEEISGITSALDLSGFETKLTEIRGAQQGIVDEFLGSVETSGTSIGELQNTYNQVTGIRAEIEGITTELDLSGFDTKLTEIRSSQQGIIDNYVNSFQTTGKSIEELEALYGEVTDSINNINGLTGELDTSGLSGCLQTIKDAQQAVVDEYAMEMTALIAGTGSTAERKELIKQLEEYSATYGSYGLDLSSVNDCIGSVIMAQQAYISEVTAAYTKEGTDAETAEATQAVLDKVNKEITDCNGMGCDVTGLVQLSATLSEKVARLTEEESKKDEEDDDDDKDKDTDSEDTTGIDPNKDDEKVDDDNPEDNPNPDDTEASDSDPVDSEDGLVGDDSEPVDDDSEPVDSSDSDPVDDEGVTGGDSKPVDDDGEPVDGGDSDPVDSNEGVTGVDSTPSDDDDDNDSDDGGDSEPVDSSDSEPVDGGDSKPVDDEDSEPVDSTPVDSDPVDDSGTEEADDDDDFWPRQDLGATPTVNTDTPKVADDGPSVPCDEEEEIRIEITTTTTEENDGEVETEVVEEIVTEDGEEVIVVTEEDEEA